MQSCSFLRSDTQELALGSDSAEVRKLANLVSTLCVKVEELERELREMRSAMPPTEDYPARLYREKPR